MEKVLILNFSPRNAGNCSSIGNYISDYYLFKNVCANTINVRILPCSDCNYECLRPNCICPGVTEEQRIIMEQILASDMVYFIVPNFCGFPCSGYYAFNERSVGFFNRDRELMKRYMDVKKRFVIVSNTESNIFVKAMHQQTNTEPDILYIKTSKYKKNSISGDLLTSDEAKEELRAFLEAKI